MDYPPPPLYENVTTALLSSPNSEINKKRYSRNKQEVIDVVLTLTEEQAIEIRKTGLSVIQFKYFINNKISHVIRAFNQLIDAVKRSIEFLINSFERIRNLLCDVRYFFEQEQDCSGHSISSRYRLIKIIGNMKYRKYDVRFATRTYRARSNC